MTSETEGESKLLVLKRQGESLCERLVESRKLEVEQLLKYTEQQWKSVLQAARQAELRSLTDDFDTQNKHTESWIRDKQQKLQSVGSHTAPEGRCHTAQVCFNESTVCQGQTPRTFIHHTIRRKTDLNFTCKESSRDLTISNIL